MKPLRALAISALVVCATLASAGCTFLEPTPIETSTPSPTIINTSKYIGGLIDPADTVWSGKDSGGDLTSLTLHADGTVAVSYGDNRYDYPGDTWDVRDEVLHVSVYLDEVHGTAYYAGTWNPETNAIDTVMRTSKTAKELTVTLVEE